MCDELQVCRGGGIAYSNRFMTVMIIVILMLKIVMIMEKLNFAFLLNLGRGLN